MADLNLRLLISATNDGAIRSLGQVEQSVRGVGSGAKAAIADLAHISGAIALWQQFASSPIEAAKAFVRAADEMKGIEARVKLASASLNEFNGNLAAIRATARASGTEVASVAALFNRIATPIRDMGGSAADARQTIAAVGNSLRITGADAQQSSAAMLQFAQALGSGVLRGDELNSILENAPRLAAAIATGLGVTTGELRKLGEQGALTSQQVLKALQSQQGTLTEEAARLPQTVSQAWTNLSEAVKQASSNLDKATGFTTGLASGLNALAGNLPIIGTALRDVAALGVVAFGARQVAAIAATTAATRERAIGARLVAADSVREAEAALASAHAVRQSALANIEALGPLALYATSTNAAAMAEERRAAAERLRAANKGVGTAADALNAARNAEEAAQKTGLFTKALGGAKAAGGALLTLFGGWPGLIITGITAAALAWDHFRDKGKEAAAQTKVSTDQMIRDFEEFAAKRGPAEQADELSKLKGRAAELRDQLLDPGFRMSGVGTAAAAELAKVEAAIAKGDAAAKAFVNNRTKERGLLGLDKLKLDVGGLVDQDTQKQLQAFSDLYKAFVAGAKNDNGQLVASTLEVKAALQGLFAAAKTPAEFTNLVERISQALEARPRDVTLQAQLENAIEARSQAEMKALNGLVAGLEARAARTQALFSQAANIALAQFNQAAALAKVAAELRNDPAGVTKVEVSSRNAEVQVAKRSADLQIGELETIASRKRALIDQEAADIKAQADGATAAVRKNVDERIAAAEKEVKDGTRSAASLKDIRVALEKEFTEKTQASAAASGQAAANAARQIREVDAQTAQQRAAIAQNLYDTLKAKANDALQAYKTYAQQVIAFDKEIVNNRLNTAGAINALKRQDQTPQEQAQSLKDELEQVKRETSAALRDGKQDFAKELLNRQQGLAQNIGSLSGEGIDPKAQRQEAIKEMTRIGQEADSIIREQKSAAEEAAAKQLEQFNQMTQAMNGLAQQITALNEQAAIKLKPTIDQEGLSAAVEAVKTAFAGLVLPVKVQAVGLPENATATQSELPARAYGGPLPGSAPHDRADNLLYWGTPGEWVIQRPAVRHYGAEFIAALNAMRLPKFAFGGQLGGSVVSRLAVPTLPSLAGTAASPTPVNLHFGGGTYSMQAAPDVVAALRSALGREALRKGGR